MEREVCEREYGLQPRWRCPGEGELVSGPIKIRTFPGGDFSGMRVREGEILGRRSHRSIGGKGIILNVVCIHQESRGPRENKTEART